MAKQVVQKIHQKNDRAVLVGVREEFKGKDIVNLREFISSGDDDLIATKSGFTIQADQFKSFFNSLRKFGRAAGLLPEAGEDPKAFTMKALADVVVADEEDDDESETATASNSDSESSSKKEKKAKKEKKEAKANGADSGDEFSMKEFKKAIKTAFKNDDDVSYGVAVIDMYKAHRKRLKNELPKRAVNALEKALEHKKDESYVAKALMSLDKHIMQ